MASHGLALSIFPIHGQPGSYPFGVSLDDDQAEVRKVLAKDSIGWNLVTDSAGQAAMLVDLYNVSALPRCFLIDEEGKIILKTDNGVEIKQTLEKLME